MYWATMEGEEKKEKGTMGEERTNNSRAHIFETFEYCDNVVCVEHAVSCDETETLRYVKVF